MRIQAEFTFSLSTKEKTSKLCPCGNTQACWLLMGSRGGPTAEIQCTLGVCHRQQEAGTLLLSNCLLPYLNEYKQGEPNAQSFVH